MKTANEAFEALLKELSCSERLRLARLILDDLTDSAKSEVDYGDEWSDEDLRDLTAYSLAREDESQSHA
ncbi:MAG: hypothetical protein HUU46_19885 [Candidatus Hydrogenedentes bacterium]|nr:hypothetical protein [Candidatus Hydrogenedentota bacterium]